MLIALRFSRTRFFRPGPGGPPVPNVLTNRTGNLSASIRPIPPRVSKNVYRTGLMAGNSSVRYAGHEFGFPSRNIPPRPYMRPAIELSLPQVENQVSIAYVTAWKRHL